MAEGGQDHRLFANLISVGGKKVAISSPPVLEKGAVKTVTLKRKVSPNSW